MVDAIDEWAAIHLPRERGAPMHTHSLGQVFSHVARTYVRAWRTILYSGRADLGHSAWSRLAEVIQGYATLRGEIQTGRRQLPLGWHGIPDRDG
ncbi:hypothetical protein [Nocardia aurantia]|uniref:hypothetical protein n=1 Tax=Nocardia aurantia TaxID=2585199 RepID=UPI001294BD35|nr:hypothetical protein [Nocardia aurantia]